MVWSPALGASKPGDKPVVWRIGLGKSAPIAASLPPSSSSSSPSTPATCHRPSTTRVFSASPIALWRVASAGSATPSSFHHMPIRPLEVRVNRWSTTSPSGLLDLVLDSNRLSLRFSWHLSEEKDELTQLRLHGVRQLGYSVHLQRMYPLAIASRAAAVRRAREHDESGQNASSLADALSVDFCSSSHVPSACSCIWDSGLVMSSSSLDSEASAVVTLQPTTMYQWCIQYHSSSGTVSDWTCGVFRTDTSSASPTFPKSPAVWIGSADDTFPVNEVRREFVLPLFEWPAESDLAGWTSSSLSLHSPTFPISAVASVTGVGYYQLWLNGKRVDPTRQLDPTWTAYERRVYFASFDVLQHLQAGGNCVGALLGGGWFSKSQHFAWQLPKPDYGTPRFLLSLNVTFSNGSSSLLVSDRQWQGRRGSVLWDSIYHGETADGRLLRPGWAEHGFQDNATLWRGVDEMPSPGGELTLMPINPIRSGPGNLHVKVRLEHALQPPNVIGAPVILPDGYLHAVNVSSPIRSVYVFDLGQNFAGWARIFMKGSAGWPVILRYGEALLTLPADQSTHVLQASFRGATQTDTYVLRGDPEGEWYEPQMTYHGFRYVSVFRPYEEGLVATQVVGVPLHTETALVGSFVSSSRVLNQVQHNLQWSMLSQMQGVFTDCPSRDERMGWMDDYLLTSDQGLYNFDLHSFYAAALQQMDDGQLDSGNYADTTPVMLDEDGDPNWSSAPIILAWKVYKHTGDAQLLAAHYEQHWRMLQYWETLYNRTGLLHMPGTYGDWSPPAPYQPIAPALPSAFIFLVDVLTFINISRALNRTQQVERYTRLYEEQLAPEFHSVFYNQSATCYYAQEGCPQAAQVLALDLPGVVPVSEVPLVLAVLVASIKEAGSFTGGETSYARLWYVLSDGGYHDLALSLALSTSYPSLGYMFANPMGVYATTIWEIFNAYEGGLPGMNSLNHVMWSSIGQWFYERLAGLELTGNRLQPLVLHPRLPQQHNLLWHVRAEHVIPSYGSASIDWTLHSPLVDPEEVDWALQVRVVLPDNLPPVPLTLDPLSRPAGWYSSVVQERGNEHITLWQHGGMQCEREQVHESHGSTAVSYMENHRSGQLTLFLPSGNYSLRAVWTPAGQRDATMRVVKKR